MSGDAAALIRDAVQGVLEGDKNRPWEAAWEALVDLGYHQVGVPESVGGAGGSLGEALAVIEAAAYAGVTVPVVESIVLAAPLLASAGLGDVTREMMDAGVVATVAVPMMPVVPIGVNQRNGPWMVGGSWRRVAFASAAQFLVLPAREPDGTRLVVVPRNAFGLDIRPGMNLAHEPRDDISLTGVPVGRDLMSSLRPDGWWQELLDRAALGRAFAICGALRRVRELTVRYAGERRQFGRPIRAFQAIQRHLALIEGWVRGTEVACRAAVEEHEPPEPFAVAAARYWASRASREVARSAHQIHGAIGVTQELDLHRWTTRLLAWASEYGDEAFWAARAARSAGRGDDPDAPWRQ